MRMVKFALVLCGASLGLVACGDGGLAEPGMLVEDDQPAEEQGQDQGLDAASDEDSGNDEGPDESDGKNFDAGAEPPQELDSGINDGRTDAGPKDAGTDPGPKDAGTTPPTTNLTYIKDIQPIFQAKCDSCHGSDFGTNKSFVSDYALAYVDRSAIRSATLSKYMPYKCEDQECGLSDAQIAKISDWVQGGAPRDTP